LGADLQQGDGFLPELKRRCGDAPSFIDRIEIDVSLDNRGLQQKLGVGGFRTCNFLALTCRGSGFAALAPEVEAVAGVNRQRTFAALLAGIGSNRSSDRGNALPGPCPIR